jgi:hypothetical protein
MLKDRLGPLLVPVLTWPEDAQHELVRAVHEIEARYGGTGSQCDDPQGARERAPPALGQPGSLLSAEMEAFLKRHHFNFF